MPAAEHTAPIEELGRPGQCLAVGTLEPASRAAAVRLRNGSVLISAAIGSATEGELERFYLIEARDLNEAIQLAAKLPAARHGRVEIRPLQALLIPTGT